VFFSGPSPTLGKPIKQDILWVSNDYLLWILQTTQWGAVELFLDMLVV